MKKNFIKLNQECHQRRDVHQHVNTKISLVKSYTVGHYCWRLSPRSSLCYNHDPLHVCWQATFAKQSLPRRDGFSIKLSTPHLIPGTPADLATKARQCDSQHFDDKSMFTFTNLQILGLKFVFEKCYHFRLILSKSLHSRLYPRPKISL